MSKMKSAYRAAIKAAKVVDPYKEFLIQRDAAKVLFTSDDANELIKAQKLLKEPKFDVVEGEDYKTTYLRALIAATGCAYSEEARQNFADIIKDRTWVYAFPLIEGTFAAFAADNLFNAMLQENKRERDGFVQEIPNQELLNAGWYLFNPYFKSDPTFDLIIENSKKGGYETQLFEGQYYIRRIVQ